MATQNATWCDANFPAYLAFYVPLAYKMGWEIGITPSSVLVSHLLVQESTSPDLLVNEFPFLVKACRD